MGLFAKIEFVVSIAFSNEFNIERTSISYYGLGIKTVI